MAVRQYIGARYVPLYVGNWDDARNYEPLSIVTDANGNSYTSLKDVPAGTALDNRDYWIQTSSFSGAVDQLRRDLNAAQSEIDTLQEDVGTIQTNVEAIQTDITSIQSDVGTIQTEISDLNSELTGYKKPYESSNILIIADSYGLTPYGTLSDRLNSKGYTSEQVAQGGRGFATSITLLSCLEEYSGDRNTIDYIVVVAGANDTPFSSSQIYAGMSAFSSYARANYPNAKLVLGHFGVRMGEAMEDNSVQAYILGSAHYGFTYMPNSQYVLRDTRFLETTDLLHPNDAGIEQIVNQMIQFFRTGQCDVYYALVITVTGQNNFANSRLRMIRRNGLVRIEPATANEDILSYTNGNAYGSLSTKPIGELSHSLICSNQNNYFQVRFTGYNSASGTTQFPITLNLRIVNKVLSAAMIAGSSPTHMYLADRSTLYTD